MYNTEKILPMVSPEEYKRPRRKAMADLFTNEYFNRAWIIQEIAVGPKVELYLGRMYIPWMIFAEYVSYVHLDLNLVTLEKISHVAKTLTLDDHF